MFTFIRAQAASLIASVVDLFTTWFVAVMLVHGDKGVWGSAAGTLAGGLVHFTMSYGWVFREHDGNVKAQAFRYVLVWAGYFLIMTGGVYLLTHFAAMNYITAKVLIAITIGIAYNFILHKKFVFK